MKTLYIDCFSGISGNMFLGGLLDLGVDHDYFRSEIEKINLEHLGEKVDVEIKSAEKHGIVGTYVNFVIDDISEESRVHMHYAETERHHGRSLAEVEAIIDACDVEEKVKKRAKKIFGILAEAEAKVHGTDAKRVHFHEVGETDSILDIVGTALCLQALDVGRILSSPVHVGEGFMDCAHGKLPLPMPATLEILTKAGIPFYRRGIPTEIATPTGVAILAGVVDEFTELRAERVEKVGYGAGTKDLEIPNMVRMMLWEGTGKSDRIWQYETNLDDCTGENLGYVQEILLEAGAKDVWFTSIQMKKNRPGTMLSVLAGEKEKEKILRILFEETSTLGVRETEVRRRIMNREEILIDTSYGPVSYKRSCIQGLTKILPEYEAVRKLSRQLNIPFRKMHQELTEIADEKQKEKGI